MNETLFDLVIKDLQLTHKLDRVLIAHRLGLSQHFVKKRLSCLNTRASYGHEQEARVKSLKEAGTSDQDIAHQVGVSFSYVRKVCSRFGLRLTTQHRSTNAKVGRSKTAQQWPEGTTERILDLYGQGIGRTAIAAQLSVDINKVHSDINRFAVAHLTDQQRAECHRKYTDEQHQQALALRRQGIRTAEISVLTNVTEGALRALFLQNGVVLTDRQRQANLGYGNVLRSEVECLRQQHLSIESIAQKMEIPKGAVKSILRDRSVTIPIEARTINSQAALPKDHMDRMRQTAFTPQANVKRSMALKKTYEDPNLRLLKGQQSSAWWATRLGESIYTQDEIGAVALELKFDLVDTQDAFVGAKKILVRCFCGNVWTPGTYDFLYRRIRSCGCIKSKPQIELTKWIRTVSGLEVLSNVRNIIQPFELDVWVPEKKLAIEYCGLHWHGESLNPQKARMRHFAKYRLCRAAGIRLITLFSDEWILKDHMVKAWLEGVLGLPKMTVGARKLTVVSVATEEAGRFLEANHLLGTVGGRHIGLKLEGDLMALASFRHLNVEGRYEMSRYCVRSDLAIPGGLRKILAASASEIKEVVTFSDRRWSDGGLYIRSGFQHDGEVAPSYWYFRKATDCPRYHKFGFRKDKLSKILGFDEKCDDMTEWQLARQAGYDRIWDCGLDRWILDRTSRP